MECLLESDLTVFSEYSFDLLCVLNEILYFCELFKISTSFRGPSLLRQAVNEPNGCLIQESGIHGHLH